MEALIVPIRAAAFIYATDVARHSLSHISQAVCDRVT